MGEGVCFMADPSPNCITISLIGEMKFEDLALLFVRGLGSRKLAFLVDSLGSSEAIFATPAKELRSLYGLSEDVAEQIARKECFKSAEQEAAYCRQRGIRAISVEDSEYPKPLLEIIDRPHVLFVKGNFEAFTKRSLSVVGTREMSPSGNGVIDRMISGLARSVYGLSIVSGLAYGVDAASHRVAIANHIPSVAVLANPLPEINPTPHRALAEDIINNGGALVSELHSQTKQNGKLFLARNRIIAGWSMGALVVEAGASGGSLATAEMVDGYHRTLMAVPGRITDSASFGTNNLIRSGKARLVITPNDIIEDMDWVAMAKPMASNSNGRLEKEEGLTPPELTILNALENATTLSYDQLLESTGLTMGELTMSIMTLEIKGFIRRLSGKMYEKI